MELDLVLKTFHPQAFAGCVYGLTGAGHGIGEATLRALCALGAQVIAIDIDEKNLRRVCAEVGPSAHALVGDVSDPQTTRHALQRIEETGGRLDGWVNNAMINQYGTIEDQPEEQFIRAFEINLLAAWRMCQAAVPLLKKRGGGSIVNISSIMARHAAPFNAAYCSTKAALEGLTRALAVELAPARIRVNAIAPGLVMTYSGLNHITATEPSQWSELDRLHVEYLDVWGRQLQPWPQVGAPQYLAAGILFLLSPASEYMTGAVLHMDGGASVRLDTPRDAASHQAEGRALELGEQIRRLKPDVKL